MQPHRSGLRDRGGVTIGDDVVIYAGATILGGDTVIGKGSVVGGNTWLTHSIPPRSRVISTPLTRAEMLEAMRRLDEEQR